MEGATVTRTLQANQERTIYVYHINMCIYRFSYIYVYMNIYQCKYSNMVHVYKHIYIYIYVQMYVNMVHMHIIWRTPHYMTSLHKFAFVVSSCVLRKYQIVILGNWLCFSTYV